MKILILGGGNAQLTAIKRAKEKGHTVIVADYYADAPGKKYADIAELVSTFDIEKNIEIAKKHQIEGVMTLGTDQPVYTAARVAQSLDLPGFIDADTALAVTNKKVMKKILADHDIPIAPYRLVKEGFADSELYGLKFPVVIKPVDSQGQRGVYKLDSIEQVRYYLKDSLSYSREEELLIEEFYENGEITVSGWVDSGQTYIISVTDRISVPRGIHIGICTSHHFPTCFKNSHFVEIKEITEKTVAAFGIKAGPIYFQMLIGKEGVKVNEISCRLGGAHEDELLPALTGINVLDLIIDGALGRKLNLEKVKNHNMLEISAQASVELVFARQGRVHSLSEPEKVKAIPGVVQARFYVQSGHEVREINNATERIGYIIAKAPSEIMLKALLDYVYQVYRMNDVNGENMILRGPFIEAQPGRS